MNTRKNKKNTMKVHPLTIKWIKSKKGKKNIPHLKVNAKSHIKVKNVNFIFKNNLFLHF